MPGEVFANVAVWCLGAISCAAGVDLDGVGGWTPWEVTVTAYCPCAKCCGRCADGRTASGVPARGKIVAAPKSIPFGTLIFVPGYGTASVQDRGGKIRGNRLDVLFETHAEAARFGKRRLTVWVWRPGAQPHELWPLARSPRAGAPGRPSRDARAERPAPMPRRHADARSSPRRGGYDLESNPWWRRSRGFDGVERLSDLMRRVLRESREDISVPEDLLRDLHDVQEILTIIDQLDADWP